MSNSTTSNINQPTNSRSILIGVLFGLSTAFLSSGVAILLKKLSNLKVHYSIAGVYTCYFGLPLAIALSAFAFITGVERKNAELYNTWNSLIWQWIYTLTSASCGVFSQILMNLSLKYEEASKISIIRTSDLFFTFLFQLLILDIHSNYLSIVGALLIFVATIIVLLFKLVDQKWNKKHGKDSDNNKPTGFKRFLFYKF